MPGDRWTLSCDPDNVGLISKLATIGKHVSVSNHTDEEFERLCIDMDFYNVVQPEALSDNINTKSLEEFPMVGQFVSLYFPLGHIKSTRCDDEEFAKYFAASEKWLSMRE